MRLRRAESPSLLVPLALLLALLAARPLRAEPTSERNPWDTLVKLGLALGSVDQSATGGSSGTYGGFPVAVGINFDLSRKISLQTEIGVIADLNNFQVTRSGLCLQAAFHLLGGARRTSYDYGNILEITRDAYNFSLILREGYDRYNVAVGTDTNPTVQGSVFHTQGGVQFRNDISENVSLVLDVYTTLYNLPASSERLKVKLTEVIGSVRFFL